ncbi:hypothetical protein D7V97_22725 [Corallococcus sp. CA053C]|uniref:hypothetical protein n=1 Tax=Corallococcus sp. CA053C TaxID=2316732 RepID=UPI000EA2E352|nr:hypothetical protein [Corallococcus sp. CA053C]RKH06287.1 hypothetical protein D7V97_22725 [Corallococcus sp. CA053C]
MTLEQLERTLALLFEHARSRGVVQVDLETRDYYWNVPSPEWVDTTGQPELVVGSLHDDAAELEKMLDAPERASAVDLDRVAAMLRAISDQIAF